jgi:hypothetical protein
MRLALSIGFILITAAASGAAEPLTVNVFGCVLSLPNMSDVSVSRSNEVKFTFQETQNVSIVSMTIAAYPGDQSWNSPDFGRVTKTYGKFLNLDERTIYLSRPHDEPFILEQVTDKKTVMTFPSRVDLAKYLTCDDDDP